MAKTKSGSATGAAAPPVQRRIEATTICFSEAAPPAAGEFAVRVKCVANGSLVFRRGDGQPPYVLILKKRAAGMGTTLTNTFPVADLRSAGACRVALRGMLQELPQLRSLHLAPDEWDAVVPARTSRSVSR